MGNFKRRRNGRNRSRGEGILERLESLLAFLSKRPWSVLPGKTGQRGDNTRVAIYEATVEIGETKERLNILHFTGFQPIEDGFNLVFGHVEAV